MGSVNSVICTEDAATAAFRNTSKTSASALLVRAVDSITLASPVNSGDSICALESPLNFGDISKTLGRTLASPAYTGDSIKTKAAEAKAGIGNSPGPTTTNFLATMPPVDFGDSSITLASPIHSGDITKREAANQDCVLMVYSYLNTETFVSIVRIFV